MSNFFTSPRERASQSLYDLAISGRTPYDAMFEEYRGNAIQNIRRSTARESAGTAGDILSQAQSAGITFGSGLSEVVSEAKGKISERGQILEGGVNEKASLMKLGSLAEALRLGLSGLSTSSTAGDVLAGLTTVGKIAGGVAAMGGPQGFDWWSGGANNLLPVDKREIDLSGLFGRGPMRPGNRPF